MEGLFFRNFRVSYVVFSSCLGGYDQACESQRASCSVVISKINMKSALFFALGVFAVFQTG